MLKPEGGSKELLECFNTVYPAFIKLRPSTTELATRER